MGPQLSNGIEQNRLLLIGLRGVGSAAQTGVRLVEVLSDHGASERRHEGTRFGDDPFSQLRRRDSLWTRRRTFA